MENIDSGGLFRYNIDKSKTLYGKPAERQWRKAIGSTSTLDMTASCTIPYLRGIVLYCCYFMPFGEIAVRWSPFLFSQWKDMV